MPELRRSEITLLFAHYDYFTGRAIRIVLTLEQTPPNLEAAVQCIIMAKKERVFYMSKNARKIAADAYFTWRLHASDLQLKLLDELQRGASAKVQDAVLGLLERELRAGQQQLTV